MPRLDIREYKKELRTYYKKIRLSFSETQKAQKDQRIADRFCSLRCYHTAKLLLCYVSTPIEVDTKQIIIRALSQGKTVAVPYCLPDTTQMEFYKITSLDDLVPRTFGVLEPVAEKCERVTDFADSIAVVPGLSFDRYGYRLGYGKGYYDRFLQHYFGTKIGLCYHKCMRTELIHGRYDIAVDLTVTEYFVKPVRLNK